MTLVTRATADAWPRGTAIQTPDGPAKVLSVCEDAYRRTCIRVRLRHNGALTRYTADRLRACNMRVVGGGDLKELNSELT